MHPIRWTTLEYSPRKRHTDWYWALGIIAAAAAATSVIFGNILFGILILIGAFTLALFAARLPKRLQVEIQEHGIVIGTMLYPFAALESFFVIENDSGAVLFVTSKRLLAPQLSIPLAEDISPGEVRNALSRHLPEEEQGGSLSERILEYFGF